MTYFSKRKKFAIAFLCVTILITFMYVFHQNYSFSLVSVIERNGKYTDDSLRRVNKIINTEKLYDDTFYTLYLSDEKLNCATFNKKGPFYNFESLKIGMNYTQGEDNLDKYDIDVLPLSKGYIYFGIIYESTIKNIKLNEQIMNILKKDGITFVYLISNETQLYSSESVIR